MRRLLVPLLVTAPLCAQVPQGYFVFSTFGGAAQKGLFLSHPRDPGMPLTIDGLHGDLVISGASSVLYRESDGALIVGERVQPGASVDIHVIEVAGTSVTRDASFSVGTGGSCCGEIPQAGLLPDGRIVVAATDIAAGPLSNYLTTSYGYQGVGIVDPISGLVTSVPITNGSQIVDVFNGMAVAPDGSAVYLGTWGPTAGDIWHLPLPAGGTATLVASLPIGLSNMAFDNQGDLWVTVLDANQPLWRVNVGTGTAVSVPTTAGQLNGIANEPTTDHLALVSGSRGTPSKSLFWLESNGAEHLLSSPGLATPSGVDVHPNPKSYGTGSGIANAWRWQLRPNPGGLPLVGNGSFALGIESNGTTRPSLSIMLLSSGGLTTPTTIAGAAIWVDPAQLLFTPYIAPLLSVTIPLPIPNDPSLAGLALYAQTVHLESGIQLATSPGLKLTIL